MASSFAYSNQTQLENLLLVTIDPSFSTQIDTWISAAERRVNQYLGYTTVSGLWNEQITGEILDARVDGDLNLVVYPRKRPINSVSQMQIFKGSNVATLTLTTNTGLNRYTIPAQQNVIIYPNYELTQTATSALFIRNLIDIKFSRFFTKVDYIAGYTSIPEDIQLATTLLAADTFMKQANKEGLIMITQGRVTKRWREVRGGSLEDRKSDWQLQAENILDQYRIASGWW